jgi:putative nucleotidyltransferase with HDIG domain
MAQELPIENVQMMLRACQGLKLYPAQHPNLQRQVADWQSCLQSMLLNQQSVILGIHQQTLFCDDYLFVDNLPAAESLMEIFEDRGIGKVIFLPGINARELSDFLVLLSAGKGNSEAFLQAVSQAGLKYIAVDLASDEESESGARKVYQQAITVTESIFNDVRIGKIPRSDKAVETVRALVATTLSEPHALLALSLIKDYDDYTFRHSVNVSVIALAVGRACGLGEADLRVLGLGALLHDLGKLRIEIAIINKPGRLTTEEFARIKQHPEEGAEILREMEHVPEMAVQIALGHHLRFDSKGYPESAHGQVMPDLVHMVAIADAYDAMTTLRPYQQPMTPRTAIQRLLEQSGSGYHPELLEKFADNIGPYPVGSVVRLSSNQIGLVVKAGLDDFDGVRLKILFDDNGQALSSPESLNLHGDEARRIVAEVDPTSKGIQVADYLN